VKAQPLVSVIIPFFNRVKFLSEAIESVLAQSYQNWELILVNDGSTDSSESIAEHFVCKYPNKIVLLGHPGKVNCGAGASRNLGIKHSKGEYITFLDSDDVFFSDTIEQESNALGAHPEAAAVCGTLQYWHSWQNVRHRREKDFVVDLGLEVEKLCKPPNLFIHNLLSGGRKPGMGCVMLRRELIETIGDFEESFRNLGEDQVFWAKVSLNARVYVINACLIRYRQHQESTCAATVLKENNDPENWFFYFEWLENYLRQQKIANPAVHAAIASFRKEICWQNKYRWVKRYYRRFLPLHMRYWLRDQLTHFKNKTFL
jgi:glycosyltransferase involved in cell wall biosynthesis